MWEPLPFRHLFMHFFKTLKWSRVRHPSKVAYLEVQQGGWQRTASVLYGYTILPDNQNTCTWHFLMDKE